MKVKNIYVTGRHKLRYTVYTGKGKRAGEYNQLQKSPRPLAVLAVLAVEAEHRVGVRRAGFIADSSLAAKLPEDQRTDSVRIRRGCRLERGANMTERKAAEEASRHRADQATAGGLPKPDWDSGNVPMTPLPPGSPSQWHTLRHGLGSTNLLVDAKLGGTNAQGQAVWSLSTETLFALTGPNALRFRWNLDEEVWGRYKEQLGITGGPRLRVWIWRW